MSSSPCSHREPGLEALLFGELAPDVSAALEAHVAECPGCRDALDDAHRAMTALTHVSNPPLPYAGPPWRDDAWREFQKRLPASNSEPTPTRTSRYRLAALAAVLVLGVALGRIIVPPPSPTPAADVVMPAEVSPDAIAALERAELLADAGVRYVNGLQSLLADVMELSVDRASTGDVLLIRERATELLYDGQLLELALDPDQDRAFLRAVRRAELLLEELAAVDGSDGATGVRVFQATLGESALRSELESLNLERDVSRAIEASGWIGRDRATRKDF